MWLGWGDFNSVDLIHCCRVFFQSFIPFTFLLFRGILTASDSFINFQFHACARLVLVNNSSDVPLTGQGHLRTIWVGWGGVGWGVCVCGGMLYAYTPRG